MAFVPIPANVYDTPSEAWAAVIKACLEDGQTIAPRKGAALELPGIPQFTIRTMQALPMAANGREFRHAIGVLEGLSLVGQVSVPETFIDRVAAFRPFVTRSVFWGAYGPRAAGDLGNVAELLMSHPDSRQAVISLYDSDRDLGRPEVVDVPCTLTLQFRIRRRAPGGDPQLELHASMRSNDAWLGLPYDLMQFAMVQAAITQHLGIEMGDYTHTAASLHLYEKHIERARDVSYDEGLYWFPWPWWGGNGDLSSTASRARRILLGQHSKLTKTTAFEDWCISILATQ